MPDFMSRDEVRDVDHVAIEKYGLPGIVLMENAARGCVDWLNALGISGRIAICSGRGNNGGDGFVIARHLENAGHDVKVLLFADPSTVSGDAAVNLNVLQKSGTPLRCFQSLKVDPAEIRSELSGADWIVDALLGTGTRGGLREPFATVISEINACSARKIAIDLPSGLDCDSGQPVDETNPLAVRADFTATIVAKKLGFQNEASRDFTGEIRVIDIGVPRAMFSD
jgi:NAD(P)H-hydrate epimerase